MHSISKTYNTKNNCKDLSRLGWQRPTICQFFTASCDYTPIQTKFLNIPKTPQSFEVNNNNVSFIVSAKLSNNKAIVCYKGSIGGNYVCAVRIVNISNDVASFGPVFSVSTTCYMWIDIVVLSSSKAIAVWQDYSKSYKLVVCVLTINPDDTFSKGPLVTINDGWNYPSLIRLSDTKVLLCYKGGEGSLNEVSRAMVLSLNTEGTAVILGNSVILSSNVTNDHKVVMISENRALACFNSRNIISNPYYGVVVILDINDTTITFSPELIYKDVTVNDSDLIYLTNNKVLISYRYSLPGNITRAGARIIEVGTSNIIVYPEIIFKNSVVTYNDIIKINSTQALACYVDISNSNFGTSMLLDFNLDNNTIELNTESVFERTGTAWINSIQFTETTALVFYKAIDNSGFGTAVIIK